MTEIGGSFLMWAIVAIVSLIIFYFIVKAAVKNGTVEAHQEIKKLSIPPVERKSNKAPNAAQMELQSRYDKGGIPFDDYLKEWDRLK